MLILLMLLKIVTLYYVQFCTIHEKWIATQDKNPMNLEDKSNNQQKRQNTKSGSDEDDTFNKSAEINV